MSPSIFERPAAVRGIPKPAPRPLPADPWFLVEHPAIPGVRTFFRSRDDADSRAFALRGRFGERTASDGRILPRVDVVSGLPS
jgi:hypothetical protein